MATRAKSDGPVEARVFKAGNSKAVRLPASFALAVGDRVELVQEGDEVRIRRKADRIDLTGIYGSMPNLRPLSREEREFEDGDRIFKLLGIEPPSE